MRPSARGIALSAILLAAVLLVAIGVAIALGARSTSANSDQDRTTLDATTIMNQGTTLANGYISYVSQTSPWGYTTCYP